MKENIPPELEPYTYLRPKELAVNSLRKIEEEQKEQERKENDEAFFNNMFFGALIPFLVLYLFFFFCSLFGRTDQ